MSEIYNINPSEQTILVSAIQSIDAVYGCTNDDQTEYVGIYIRDAKIGEVFIPVGFPAAAQLIANISGVLGNRDDLRNRYNGGDQQ